MSTSPKLHTTQLRRAQPAYQAGDEVTTPLCSLHAMKAAFEDGSTLDPTRCPWCHHPSDTLEKAGYEVWSKAPCTKCGKTADDWLEEHRKRTGRGIWIGEMVVSLPGQPGLRGWPYHRKTWLPSRLRLDSIQGVLEFAERYPREKLVLAASREDRENPYHATGMMRELEQDGYLRTEWSEVRKSDDGDAYLRLEKAWLTPKGYDLLQELRQRSPYGRWLKRLRDFAWIALTSIVTTLLTLHVTECGRHVQ